MKIATPKKKRFSLNMTSMIDVIFLLIVFFVMSSKMIQDEVAMEMNLPRESSGETIVDDETEKIVLNVEKENAIYLGTKLVNYDEIKERLRQEKARSARPKSVRIRANRDVPYSAIEPILVICAQTGFADVSFAVVEQ